MRILLTGAGGYIGLHLVRALLDAGHAVTALVRAPGQLGPFTRAPGLRIVEADLEEGARVAAAVAGHDVLVHAALIWGAPGSELEMRDTAVAAKLFDAAGRSGVALCVYLSSVAVHRPFAPEMDEASPLGTTDLYGATKAAGELVLRASCATHGMSGVVIRSGPVVGPPAFAGASFRSDHRIAGMVAAAREARPIEVVANEGRQLTDVATLAEVTRRLVSAAAPEPTYVCVDRQVFTWEAIARTVVSTLGSTSEVRVLPPATPGPIPRFRTDRLERLLGRPADAREALVAHIRHLAA